MIIIFSILLISAFWFFLNSRFSFLKELDEGIVWIDAHFKVRYRNRAVEKFLCSSLSGKQFTLEGSVLSDQEESIFNAIRCARKKEHLFFTPDDGCAIALSILPISKGVLLTFTDCSSFDHVIAKGKKALLLMPLMNCVRLLQSLKGLLKRYGICQGFLKRCRKK